MKPVSRKRPRLVSFWPGSLPNNVCKLIAKVLEPPDVINLASSQLDLTEKIYRFTSNHFIIKFYDFFSLDKPSAENLLSFFNFIYQYLKDITVSITLDLHDFTKVHPTQFSSKNEYEKYILMYNDFLQMFAMNYSNLSPEIRKFFDTKVLKLTIIDQEIRPINQRNLRNTSEKLIKFLRLAFPKIKAIHFGHVYQDYESKNAIVRKSWYPYLEKHLSEFDLECLEYPDIRDSRLVSYYSNQEESDVLHKVFIPGYFSKFLSQFQNIKTLTICENLVYAGTGKTISELMFLENFTVLRPSREPSEYETLPEEFFSPLIKKNNKNIKNLHLENLSILLFGQFFKDFISSIMHESVREIEFGSIAKLSSEDRWGLKDHPFIIDSKLKLQKSPTNFVYKMQRQGKKFEHFLGHRDKKYLIKY